MRPQIKVHAYTSDEEWHALRAECITSTDCAALFDLSPYLTRFELWHNKLDKTVTQIADNERMRWGNRLERAIAEGVCRDNDWTGEPFKAFVTRLDAPIGSSFDWDIRNTDGTPGILEIKNVDGRVFNEQWTAEECPPHIELQLQHQLEVIGYEWGVIAALVNGNRVVLYQRDRDAAVGAGIIKMARQLYAEIKEGKEPTPDFTRDARTISRLYGHAEEGKVISLTDERAQVLAASYKDYAAAEKAAAAAKEACKAELLTLCGDAERILLPGYSISASMVKGGPVSYERKDYRGFRVSQLKEQK
jgi:putative phage-type endonuclease